MGTGTNNNLYHSGLQFRIEIKDRKENETIAVFDPFADSNPFALTGISIDLSYFQTGAFTFLVNDTKDRVVSGLLDNEMVAFIEGGKTKDDKIPFLSGFIEVEQVASTKNNLIYQFTGLSKQALWNYSQIEYQRIAQPSELTELSPVLDQSMRIDRIIRQVLNSDNVFPIIDEKTLRERGNYSLEILMDKVFEVAGSIDFKGSAGALFDNLANSAGAILLINNKNEVEFAYPFSRNTGLLFKEFVENEQSSDDPDRTAYIHGTLSRRSSTSTNDGFYNAIILDYQPEEVAESNEGSGIDFLSLDRKDICFQFIPNSTSLSNLAFLMSKKGTGRSNIEDSFDIGGVQGFIVTDDGQDNPSAGVVATFEIPYDQISSVPSIITGFQINRIAPSLDPLRKHWCIFAASGVTPENTIHIFTDGDNTTLTNDNIPILRRVGIRIPNSPKPNPQLKAGFHSFFQVSSTGPVPRHTFFTASQQEIYYQDSLSISTWTPDRPKMTRISAPFIKDFFTAQKFASAILEYSAKKKIIFEEVEVQIPNKPIFPLQTGYLQYTPFGYSKNQPLFFEVNGVRYIQDATSRPKGIDTCLVNITAFVDHYLLNRIHGNSQCLECMC